MKESTNPHGRPISGCESIADHSEQVSAPVRDHDPGSLPSESMHRLTAVGSILVIEDDTRIAKSLQRLFTMEGYEFTRTSCGKPGLDFFSRASADAVILDLMLPDISGYEICKKMKQTSPDIPVVILSATAEVPEKVLLLEAGADDYITKPFNPRELLARVQAAIRRSKRRISTVQVKFGDIQVDFSAMRASKRGKPIPLTGLEFRLLRFFLDNSERVITREELMSSVWQYNGTAFTRTVDNQILKLRQKLEDDPASPVHFCTVHGAGYRFVPLAQ